MYAIKTTVKGSLRNYEWYIGFGTVGKLENIKPFESEYTANIAIEVQKDADAMLNIDYVSYEIIEL